MFVSSDQENQPQRRGSPPRGRSRRRPRHIEDNYFIGPARDASALEIWAYTDSFSYVQNETVELRVSTTADTYDVEIGRDGVAYERMAKWSGLSGYHADTPPDCSVVGCGWPVGLTIEIGADWPAGGYLITLRGYRGEETVEEHHLILVRHGTSINPVVLVCATPTWIAYNCWGGSNAYEGITGETGDRFSPELSTERPWTRGFCKLPEGAPRAIPESVPQPGEIVRYPYMEWAYAHGYSKKYASAGWASYERHFARWAEDSGYDLDFLTLHDLERDPGLLDDYPCAVFVGHDEYWSANMRHAVDAWVEAGGKAARFAGNFLWQIRIEDDGARQVCHKYDAVTTDPVFGTDHADLLTGAWEMAEIDWPGSRTFGVNGLRGVYAGLGNCVGRGAGGFTIYRPEHWAFENAQIGYGDVLGADSRIFGYEVDGLEYIIREGLPYPTGEDGAASEVVILGLGLASNLEADHGVWGEEAYIGDNEVAWKAMAIYGDTSPHSLARATRGSGMMIHWKKGDGEIFTAATCEWVMGLARRDRQIEQITRNVLDRFTGERRT